MDFAHVVLYPTALMGTLGLVFGVLLAVASIAFFVKPDDRVELIREALPGANCAGCGYPGCDNYAEAVVVDGARTTLCMVGGSSVAAVIAGIMGVKAEAVESMRSFLKCAGTPECSPRNAIYSGIQDCRSAAVLPGGSPNSCPYGCIGLGTCVEVCVFGALSMKDGLPSVDLSKCTGCGTCVANCPKSVLKLVPRREREVMQVVCNSHWRGPDVKKVCSTGCIGCGICVKTCPEQAIVLENNLAVINIDKCTGCGACVAKCPSKCIHPVAGS
ncbi:MAG: RnfABCDGE type electron transport complex subunit B [Fretibacterium sp.]|nr:RnfABCDGE type electron transport complex subunit B [Fretibacterium sp.]